MEEKTTGKWPKVIVASTRERVHESACTLSCIAEEALFLADKISDREATPKHVERLINLNNELELAVSRWKNDVSFWADAAGLKKEIE